MAMHTNDTVFHLHVGGEPTVGLRATRAAFAAAASQWPDIRFEKSRVYIGDGHFVSEYQMIATSDGKQISCDGVDVIAVVEVASRGRTPTSIGRPFIGNGVQS